MKPADIILINVAVESGIFEILAKSNVPISEEEIAAATQADPIFLARILRGLASMGGVEETARGYSPSKMSQAFMTAKGSSAAKFW